MLNFLYSIFNLFCNFYPFKKVKKPISIKDWSYVLSQKDVGVIHKKYKYILPYRPQSGDKDAHSGNNLVGKSWQKISEIYCARYSEDLNRILLGD